MSTTDKKTFIKKLETTNIEGQIASVQVEGPKSDSVDNPPDLFGAPNETNINLNSNVYKSLLDTGSTVSTVSLKCHSQMKDSVLYPLADMLHIECADGQDLPYFGYTEAVLQIPGIEDSTRNVLLLVVPDAPYNAKVPILLGTNVLKPLMDDLSKSNPPKRAYPALTSTWNLAFKSIHRFRKDLGKRKGRLGVLKSAVSETVRIPRNQRVTVDCAIAKGVHFSEGLCMVHSAVEANLPAAVEIAPFVVWYNGDKAIVPVEISNMSTHPLLIQPHQLVCELQQVVLDTCPTDENAKTDDQIFLDQFNFEDASLSSSELSQAPDTPYNAKVPILLGTNVLKPLMDDLSKSNPPKRAYPALTSTWNLAFKSIHRFRKDLGKRKGRLGVLKSAVSETVRIPRNQRVTVDCAIAKGVHFSEGLCMVHSAVEANLPAAVEIAPFVVWYNGDKAIVPVEISNMSTHPLLIQPHQLVCELQQVVLDTCPIDENAKTDDQIFLDQFNFEDASLSSSELSQARDLLVEYKDIFSHSDFDIGHVSTVKHPIVLNNDAPFKQRHRRIPPGMIKEVKDHLQKLLDTGIIKPSASPWASPVVLVRKSNGSLRFCIDYRQLNLRTVKDSYALPRIDELIDNLAGNTYFSSLDMRSGYYQVEVEDNDQAKTAFTTGPMGFWEFKRMPFGLTNAPATFQRLMERVMGELHMVDCFTFIDDILVPGKNFPDHLDKLRRVFQKIREHNLKLNPQKCSFFKNKVVYGGHVVSSSGVETDPQKVEKIKHWPVPTDAAKVREFLGFAGYYRRFVKDFSIIAKPLTNLLVGVMGKKGKLAAKSANWKWGEEEQSAFNSLRDRLMSPPILAYPDYERPFVLHVDACASGLGAVLCQESDGMERVISYASRGLSQSERNYPAHKLEFLALKWSVTEKFNDYLYGHEFSVLTDNNPLTYVLTSAKLDATGHRWLAALAAYTFTLKYRPGKSNADADGLSRLANPDRREMSSAAVESLCKSAIYSPWVNVVCFSAQIAKDLDVHGEFNPKDWRKIQLDDPHIFPIHRCVTNGEKLRKNKYAHKETLQLYRSVDNFELQRGVLYRSTIVDGKKKLQLVLPKSYRAQAIRGLHDDMGHLGRDRTLNLLRDRFFWPRMATDVDDWVHKCTRCIMRKTPSHFKAPLVNITSTQPMELVCMDYLSLETSKGGFENILVVVDHFTKYAQAIPTKNQTAKTTANALFNNYFVHYGYPLRLHSDQGANFTGKVISELCKMTGIERSVTTPYHPMGNGVTERFNQTLLNLLGTLDPKEKPDWKSHVGPLVHAYNATKHDSTKHSPFLLMFGREPRLPIDLALGLPDFQEGKGGHAKFIDNLRNTLKDSYQLASQEASKAATRQKTTYDRHARAGAVRVGDRVLVRILAYEGKHKIANKWEPEPCIVVEQADPNIPVYVVQPETGSRGRRTLHLYP